MSLVASQVVVAIENARLHDSVRRGKREWEQTFDAISDPIAVFDSRGQLLRGNTALAAHLGRAVTALRTVGCHAVGFCGGGCPSCAVGRALTQDGGRAEITLADGQIFSVTTFPVGNGREGASVVQVAKNVTEEIRSARRLRHMSEELAVTNARLMAAVDQLKSTQAQLLQAEKLSAIGQLVAGVAHELNNPLTSVIGYAQLLEEELLHRQPPEGIRPPRELAQDMRRIAEESERAARIVRNLQTFARKRHTTRTMVDLNHVVRDTLALRAYEQRVTNVVILEALAAGLPQVFADPHQIQQVLLNLIINGEQAMLGAHGRGTLILRSWHDLERDAVKLEVSDDGPGIPLDVQAKIFDPFFTTKEVGKGTGLGLTVAYAIAQEHGGSLSVASAGYPGGRGASFTLELPVGNLQVRPGPVIPARPAPVVPKGTRALVVEDEAALGTAVADALSDDGFVVDRASNGQDAVALIAERSYDLVICDLKMPKLDGPSLYRRLAETHPALSKRMVFVTGDVAGTEAERFLEESGCRWLAKPFRLRDLVRLARETVS
jgi:two-component system NtrC family sensor kinase